MVKIALADLPEDIRKKIAKEHPEPREEKTFQLFASDLARVFGVDVISDMFVVVVDGQQVLRVRCYDKKDTEYPTVTAPSRKQKRASSPKPQAKPKGILEKIVGGGQSYLKGKQQDTNWIKKFNEGPKW